MKKPFNVHKKLTELKLSRTYTTSLKASGITKNTDSYLYISNKDFVTWEEIFIAEYNYQNKFIEHKYVPQGKTFPDKKDEFSQQCINHLKSLGYKIMKPINDFIEV